MTDRPDAPGAARFLPALLSAMAFIAFLPLSPQIVAGEAARWSAQWLPALGIGFAFLADGLSLVFALVITGIGALILLYTSAYFRNHPQLWRILILLGLFELSMLGLVLADDVATLFLFWEGTTITSFLLIGFEHEKAEARAKAIQALVVTALGGLAMLGGLILCAEAAGSWRLSDWSAAGLRDHAFYLPIIALIFAGCFTKSAQFPFHFWLPNAMAAPSPVSAYLHSATMVKAGIYLLARLTPSLGGTPQWSWTLVAVGALTMLLGAVWSLAQNDLKLALAHTTTMGLGTLTLFLGLGGEGAILGFCVFLLVHAFYKAALFLVIGCLDKMAGSRAADRLSGLGRAMPLTFLAALLAGASMAGLPPLFGFIGKEALYEGALHAAFGHEILIGAAVLANAMMLAVGGAVGLSPFIGRRKSAKAEPRDAVAAMLAGPAVLAGLGVALGLAPFALDGIVGAMAQAVSGHAAHPHFALWHGVNDAFWLSLATFALGGLFFLALPRLRPALAALGPRLPQSEWLYDGFMVGLARGAALALGALQSGLPSRYLASAFAGLTALIAAALLYGGEIPAPVAPQPRLLPLTAAVMIAFATVILPFTRRRLLLVTALGIVGSGVALIFAAHGAVDVAITQLMVETLVVVILAVALLKLPKIGISRTPQTRRRRNISAGLAAAFGLTLALATQAVLDSHIDLALSEYFAGNSAPVAYGRNIVNVILVDLRGVDTMGELAVIAMAGLAALALLAIRTRALEDRDGA